MDVNYFWGLIWRAKNEIQQYLAKIEDCNRKIDRLKAVYNEIGDIKGRFLSGQRSTLEIFSQKGTWRGEKYTTFQNDGEELDDLNYSYYKQLDAAQDQVNNKILEFKNEKTKYDLLTGRLRRQINGWYTAIQNATN